MNGKERMKIAMQGGTPDRTPLMCQFSMGFLALNFTEDLIDFWYTPEGLADAYIRAAEECRFDGVLVDFTSRQPGLKEQIAKVEEGEDGGKKVTMKNGDLHIIPRNDEPIIKVKDPGEPRPSDIDELDPDEIEERWNRKPEPWEFNVLKNVLERKGDSLSVHGEVGTSLEGLLWQFGDIGDGLMALLDDGEKAKDIIGRINRVRVQEALRLCALGIDALKLSSPFAGAGFISREMYREFVMPYEREIIRAAHKEFGIPCYIHTCGAIGDRLDLMMETETDGLECLDPPPLGTVDLAEAPRILGDKVFIKGNLDSVNELKDTRPEQVLEIAKKRLEIGRKHRGGYILSTACSIAPEVPLENIMILREAVES